MHIQPFFATLPKEPSRHFFKNVRSLAPGKINWEHFQTASAKAFIIYHIQTPSHSFRGLVTLTGIEDFANFRVLPHEKTLIQKERSTLSRLRLNQGMCKPILLTYEPSIKISDLCLLTAIDHEPDYIYEDFEVQSRHVIWLIKDPDLQKVLQQEFEKIEQCYLADGHHRAKSLLSWSKKKNGPVNALTAYFNFDEVHVSPYNRVVLKGLDFAPDALEQIKKFATEIDQLSNPPRAKHEFLVLFGSRTIRYKWKTNVLLRSAPKNPQLLDSYLINRFLLKQIFGLKKIRDNDNIIYVEGLGGVAKVARQVKEDLRNVGFCLFPISKQDFINSSQSCKMLPAKSTWFQPRLPSGLINQRFNPS